MSRSVAEIKAEFAEIKAELAVAEGAVWKYDLWPVEGRHGKDMFDLSCKLYRLSGRLEPPQPGQWSEPSAGSMDYLFNTLSGKFVMAVGGGTAYFTGYQIGRALNLLSEFVGRSPEGGDVSNLINHVRKEVRP